MSKLSDLQEQVLEEVERVFMDGYDSALLSLTESGTISAPVAMIMTIVGESEAIEYTKKLRKTMERTNNSTH